MGLGRRTSRWRRVRAPGPAGRDDRRLGEGGAGLRESASSICPSQLRRPGRAEHCGSGRGVRCISCAGRVRIRSKRSARVSRKLGNHLFLGAAQNIRVEGVVQKVPCPLVKTGAGARGGMPQGRGAEHAGIQVLEMLQSSPRWFSTGVPVSARRLSASSSRGGLRGAVAGFLMFCASSSTA